MQKLYKEYLSELKTMKLFYGIQESEMTAMLGCIGAYLKEYKKNQYIITLEENVEAVGILLSGWEVSLSFSLLITLFVHFF